MTTGSVDLHWIPLGAGASVVRLNGRVYEAVTAAVHRRARRAIVHTALEIAIGPARWSVEMTPVPDGDGAARGVVATGPVGLRPLGRWRLFRYEVRRWRDGVVPDLAWSVAGPVRVTDDVEVARRVFDALPNVPGLTWGRDERRAGEMWTCNSIISWALTRAGVDVTALSLPDGARAPGWDAGRVVATTGGARRAASSSPG